MSDRPPNSLSLLSRADSELAIPADDIRGCVVLDQAGYEIGHVDDLLVDPAASRVYFMILRPSGMLMDDAQRLIPIDAVRSRTDESVHVEQDFEQVAVGPQYVPELIFDPGYQAGVYGWYGYVPYWHPGYVRPGWPQR